MPHAGTVGPGKASRGEVTSWALYDFGSSAFNTIVVTFLFSEFFANVIAGTREGAADLCVANEGAILWTRAITVSAVVVALMMPLLGAIADYSGRKKPFLVGLALVSITFTVVLFFVGLPGHALAAALVFVVANIAFEAGNVLYNAFLPEVATPGTMGRVSGLGFFLGYIGGIISLGLCLWLYQTLPGGEEGAWLNIRASLLVVAAWFLVFALPLFLFVRERAERRRATMADYARIGFSR
ncbi:MAG TPA: MFS transporter, partial [Longimicrobiales bacterium]|nr:MFS transporter [Longimicrobiales bacterium]